MSEPDADGKVTIRYEHFLWLNKESLRLGDGWREAANEVKRLKREVERLEQEVADLKARADRACKDSQNDGG